MNTLFIVASPIGNLKDISQRAIDTLQSVNTIFCEDTRVSIKLLNALKIEGKKLISLNKDNESAKIHKVLEILSQENTILISDAGTPLISDPGAKVLETIYAAGHKVSPIPGASALTSFLSICPIDFTGFIFEGFLPHGPKQRRRVLKKLYEADTQRPIVFFESPHRIKKTLVDIEKIFSADTKIFMARELTKLFEQSYYGDINTVIEELENQFSKDVQGEFVFLIA
jgi:16S rRNA (cytidine1402-2'-O)-methyltransferase